MTTHNHDAVIEKLRAAAAAGTRLVPHLKQEMNTALAKVEDLSRQLAETHEGITNAERAIAALEHDQQPGVILAREFPDEVTLEELDENWLATAPIGRVVRVVADDLANSVDALDRIARHVPEERVSRRVRAHGFEQLHLLGGVHLFAEVTGEMAKHPTVRPNHTLSLVLAVAVERQDSVEALMEARAAGYRVMRLAINPADADTNIAARGADHA